MTVLTVDVAYLDTSTMTKATVVEVLSADEVLIRRHRGQEEVLHPRVLRGTWAEYKQSCAAWKADQARRRSTADHVGLQHERLSGILAQHDIQLRGHRVNQLSGSVELHLDAEQFDRLVQLLQGTVPEQRSPLQDLLAEEFS